MNHSENPAVTTSECDVLVIGGGPAGSTAAALLAERGYRRPLILFKAVYYVGSLFNIKRTVQAWRRRQFNIRAVDEAGAVVN